MEFELSRVSNEWESSRMGSALRIVENRSSVENGFGALLYLAEIKRLLEAFG